MIVAVGFLAAFAGAAQAKDITKGPLTLSDLQMRATPAGLPTSAAYLTISNAGKTPDKLVSIACACASSAMVHESRMHNGISSMSMVGELTIPAGGKVRFKPDGLHVMLVGLRTPLKAGSTQEMTLRFEKAGTVKAAFPVKAVIAAH
jgi:copper(I)-binding protein